MKSFKNILEEQSIDRYVSELPNICKKDKKRIISFVKDMHGSNDIKKSVDDAIKALKIKI